jgi:oligopeptide/dipeptide ABC transporter ATP-binding protein
VTARLTSEPLLEVRDLTVEFPAGRRRPPLRALERASLSVAPGETVGLVGESGSGKTTLALAILGLVPVASGHIRFAGQDLASIPRRSRRALGRDLQMVFQDPYTSLNPARTVGQALSEPLDVHQTLTRAQVRREIATMLDQVGLPADAADRYPSEFSGGQRQRIAIGRALIVSPKLVICDEAVSALDLSIQAQILNLLADLQRNLAVAYLFVSHDLAVVRHLSSRVTVLYRGQVMESGPAREVCDRPSHPYTRDLLAAVPAPDPAARPAAPVAGRAANLPGGPGGCPYHGRCPLAVPRCHSERPQLRPATATTVAACHLLPECSLTPGGMP